MDINITMFTALYQDYFYEAAISPGEEFELFTTTQTDITNKSKFSTYYALYLDNFTDSRYSSSYFDCKHILISSNIDGTEYVFPSGTRITMIDKVQKKYYYYVVSQEDEESNKYKYNLSDFIGMGSDEEPFDERAANRSYYDEDQDIVYENYIFHVDFKETNIKTDVEEKILLIELQDESNQTLLGVLGIQRETTKYSIYSSNNATIQINGEVNPDVVYLGNEFDLVLNTNYEQKVVNSKIIYDTQYFNYKMGVKISIFDENNKQLNIDSLLGVTFTLNNTIYYPSVDGTIRFSVADKLSNVLSRIKIDTTNNTVLPTGTYTMKIEGFGSPDGICYGTEKIGYTEIILDIINGKYGLKVTTDDVSKIVDKTTGKTLMEENNLPIYLNYTSALSDPSVTISLERRDYNTQYSVKYNKVDLKDYVINTLIDTDNEYEYHVLEQLQEINTINLELKEDLPTGTYKIVFKLYNEATYIGEAYEYVIIK